MAGASAKVKIFALIFCLFDISLCLPSYSWERKTEDRIIATALSSLPGETGTFLKDRYSFFLEGLRADPGTVSRYAGFSGFDTTGYAAEKLGGQIASLRDLFSAEHSDYMAYRLGILTRLILDLNSPFAAETTRNMLTLRDRFMKDVEAHLSELSYIPRSPRVIRSPVSYVGTALERSAGWAGPVRSQYITGKGYNFIVQRAASKFYNEAIHSVMDVLYTVGSGRRGEVDETARYDFYRDACDFYLRHGKREEALEAYRKMGEIASVSGAGRIDSIEDAVSRYELILQVFSLEESMKAEGIKISKSIGEKMMDPFLSEMSRLAKRYMDSGQKEKARVALEMCLRENYLPEWTLENLRRLYGLDKIENLDVPENAWKVYLEANGFESMAGRAYNEGRLWAANDSFVRAAALYSAIPDSVRDLRRPSRSRINQVIGKMRTIPPEALLSEELFQAAVDSIDGGDVDSAVKDLQLSQRWGASEKAVGVAIDDAESLQLFIKGRDLFRDERYEEGMKYFRKLRERFPRSPFAGPAKKMIEMYERRRALEAGKLRLFLKGAYEASFVGDKDTTFDLCDEILKSSLGKDLRDRAHLLILVTWYKSNQKGYLKIERVLRKLLQHRVIKVDGGNFILRKNIDFYFGLRDPFPDIELAKLDDSLIKRLDLAGEDEELADARDEAEVAMDRAESEIEAAEALISRGEAEDRNMSAANSLLDDARDRLDDARDRFGEGAYEEARESAVEAFDKAASAREKAEEVLEIATDLRSEARDRIEEAESAVSTAESTLADAEAAYDKEFPGLRSDLEEAIDFLDEARSLFDEGNYEAAQAKASEAVNKAEEVTTGADEPEWEES